MSKGKTREGGFDMPAMIWETCWGLAENALADTFDP
jgi:hypothetical protein